MEAPDAPAPYQSQCVLFSNDVECVPAIRLKYLVGTLALIREDNISTLQLISRSIKLYLDPESTIAFAAIPPILHLIPFFYLLMV